MLTLEKFTTSYNICKYRLTCDLLLTELNLTYSYCLDNEYPSDLTNTEQYMFALFILESEYNLNK